MGEQSAPPDLAAPTYLLERGVGLGVDLGESVAVGLRRLDGPAEGRKHRGLVGQDPG